MRRHAFPVNLFYVNYRNIFYTNYKLINVIINLSFVIDRYKYFLNLFCVIEYNNINCTYILC